MSVRGLTTLYNVLHLTLKTGDKSQQTTPVTGNHATAVKPSSLLTTCQTVKARALLDAGSSTSFISVHLTKTLHSWSLFQELLVSLTVDSLTQSHQSKYHLCINPANSLVCQPSSRHKSPANSQTCSVSLNTNWSHLQGLVLADPRFGQPSVVDVLLGIDILLVTLVNGRRSGSKGTLSALETEFRLVLARGSSLSQMPQPVSQHATLLTGDDLLHRFCKNEEAVWCSCFVNRGEGRHETFWRHSLSLSGWVIHCSSPKWNTLTLAPSQPQEISMQQRTVQWLCWSNWEILLTWTCWGSSYVLLAETTMGCLVHAHACCV